MNCKKQEKIRTRQFYATNEMNLLEQYRRELIIKKYFMKG